MLTMLGRSLGLVLLVATLVPAAPLDRAVTFRNHCHTARQSAF